MFFPVKSKDGKLAYINLTQVFAFVEFNNNTIAISVGGTTFDIPEKLTVVMEELDDFLEGENE